MNNCSHDIQNLHGDESLLKKYEATHPLTVKNFRVMEDGAYWFERLVALDSSWKARAAAKPEKVIFKKIPDEVFKKAIKEYDLVYAGGGLATLHAAVMAHVFKKKVLVFDRFTVGITHRDWNISIPELRRLVEIGFLTEAELQKIIVRKYRGGFVKFFDENADYHAEPLWFENVLDVAVSANELLKIALRKLQAAGGEMHDGAAFKKVFTNGEWAVTEIERGGRPEFLKSRVLIDMMGAFSPIARFLNPKNPFTHCCPTVGAISKNFKEGTARDEVDYSIGEILVTLGDADETGRQLIWEGFPSGGTEYVTYLFFYDEINSERDKSLLNLYEIYFKTLHDYKKPGEDFDIGRPVFGVIPSILHTGFKNGRRTASDNVISLGDAAALSSPLTYCGFGSFVRNLERTTTLLKTALDGNFLKEKFLKKINAYEPHVSLMANFAAFLVGKKTYKPSAVNSAMNMFMDVLAKVPRHIGEEIFRDTVTWRSYQDVMQAVPKLHPKSYNILFEQHGARGLFWWAVNFVGFSWHESKARLFKKYVFKNGKTLTKESFGAKVRRFELGR